MNLFSALPRFCVPLRLSPRPRPWLALASPLRRSIAPLASRSSHRLHWPLRSSHLTPSFTIHFRHDHILTPSLLSLSNLFRLDCSSGQSSLHPISRRAYRPSSTRLIRRAVVIRVQPLLLSEPLPNFELSKVWIFTIVTHSHTHRPGDSDESRTSRISLHKALSGKSFSRITVDYPKALSRLASVSAIICAPRSATTSITPSSAIPKRAYQQLAVFRRSSSVITAAPHYRRPDQG